jgi:transmembrane 9 superfamily member 2/4
VPVGTYFGLVAAWFLISIPLAYLGGYLTLRLPLVENPVKTNQIPRHIPPPPLSAHPTLLFFAGAQGKREQREGGRGCFLPP